MLPAPHLGLVKPNCSMATTPASVTTARLTPRTRNADAPTNIPIDDGGNRARQRPPGKGDPVDTNRRDTVNPDTPARVTCASEACPTNPVMTTSDRHTTMPISDSMNAWRYPNGSTTSMTAATAARIIVGRATRVGRGAAGNRFSTSSPRAGKLRPRTNSATTMMRNVSSDCTPGSGPRWALREPRFRRP